MWIHSKKKGFFDKVIEIILLFYYGSKSSPLPEQSWIKKSCSKSIVTQMKGMMQQQTRSRKIVNVMQAHLLVLYTIRLHSISPKTCHLNALEDRRCIVAKKTYLIFLSLTIIGSNEGSHGKR